MKKTKKLLHIFLLTIISLAFSFKLFAGNLVIGASAIPHAEILNFAKPILKEKGVNIKVIEFQDYVLPNIALKNKDIDANFFQHTPYLENQIKENNYKFVNAGSVHIEPIGIYSKNYKNIKDVKDGSTVLFSNSVSDRGRILSLLEKAGFITLKKGKKIVDLDFKDIVKNPKNLKFKNDIDPAILPRAYFNNEADLMVINTNYALEASLNPLKDALVLEDINSPFANIIVVREEDKNKADIKTLVEVLQSPKVADFIKKKYNGTIIPASASKK